jgi:hypothetical protein
METTTTTNEVAPKLAKSVYLSINNLLFGIAISGFILPYLISDVTLLAN